MVRVISWIVFVGVKKKETYEKGFRVRVSPKFALGD
jgi:hypothetical protein